MAVRFTYYYINIANFELSLGSKKDVWISINPETGSKMETLPPPAANSFCPISHPETVFIGKTEYKLSVLDTKNKEIRFGVDKTKPNVVLDNLESGQTYPLEKLKVSMIANDNLLLNSVVVYLDNYDKAYKTWDAKEIADILGKNGEFTFDVSGNSTRAHKMKVVCTDAAGNKITKEIKDFYVTTNLFIRYYNNKLLFFGSIAGFLLIVGVIVYAIVRKKKAK